MAVTLPEIVPMVLRRIREPFDHPAWLFELKYDGFRALAYLQDGACRLISRNGNRFSFPRLAVSVAAEIGCRDAILDGEIVCLDRDGRPQFNALLYRRQEPCFAVFDLLWLNGVDLRALPLTERKRRLRRLVPARSGAVLHVGHTDQYGTDLYRAVCENDLEGVVAKWKDMPYGTDPTSWLKIKNPRYSQADGRYEQFERSRTASARS